MKHMKVGMIAQTSRSKDLAEKTPRMCTRLGDPYRFTHN